MAASGSGGGRVKRRWQAPEVVQTSAMDCGPAALKCLLEGFGVPANYGRLREACHTAVDGTSIDTLEALAGQLGLEAEQITLPVEHLLRPQADALPALVVVSLPSGLTHFVVVWRVLGPYVQVMDPGRGRHWMRATSFLREVYVHEARVSAEALAEWVRSEGFQDPLSARLRHLGAAGNLMERAAATPGWRGLATLDAAVRACEALVAEKILPGHRAGEVVGALFRSALAASAEASPLGDEFWSMRPARGSGTEAADDEVLVRGAVALRALGPRVVDSPPAIPEVAAVVKDPEPRPAQRLLELLRADGLWRWPPLLAALALAAAGAVFEALLFRSFLDVGRRLALVEQRLIAVGALAVVVAVLLLLEWPVARTLWGMGRRLELTLRRLFLEKLPRVKDRYFASRPVSDLAERAHLVHWLRILPGQAGLLVRTACELLATTAGIIWLHPPSAPIAVALAGAMLGIPLLFQPALVQRDLRMRCHAGGLARFYLDALLGLVAIRAHAADAAIRREHGERLGEWARAAWSAARAAVSAEAVQMLVGGALAAWLLVDYLVSAPGSGWALLLVYWALALPVLGQELGFLVQQYPQHRNVTLRLVEPLDAPEAPPPIADRPGVSPRGGVALRFDQVVVRAAGRDVLSVDGLDVRAGSEIAVVGPSGGGKTTLLGLLLGWHEASAGAVTVDGAPLDDERARSLRRETAWIEPGVYLWNRTLLANLRYGSSGPPRPVGAAVEEADLDEVLGRLPVGLQTSLGEGGALLSGGEGQRVRVGRAIQRGPARLVLLDEAFRGLERSRRSVLLARLRARFRGATVLCVTHDIAETLSFERVLVIEGGRIIEDGAPASLAARPSRYRGLLEAERRVADLLVGAAWRRLSLQDGHLVGAPAAAEAAE